MTDTSFVSIPKAALELGVDRRTLWRWVKAKKVRSLVTPGGHHRIPRSEIEALLRQPEGTQNDANRPAVILIVDDDQGVRKTLARALARRGYQILTASDGFTAGMKVREVKPDLVILDIMMEGLDGLEVCRIIKADPCLSDAKVLILTGYATPENRKRALREGAEDFLAKDLGFKNVLERIDTLLAEASRAVVSR